jgi:hypothetical protein
VAGRQGVARDGILRADYGYEGSVDPVKKRLAKTRPARSARRKNRLWPGQVLQLDWAEGSTRPRIAGADAVFTR